MNRSDVTGFEVRSSNFGFHEPKRFPTYDGAIAGAKAAGWEAHIYALCNGRFYEYAVEGRQLVATWSPLYGTKVYARELAS